MILDGNRKFIRLHELDFIFISTANNDKYYNSTNNAGKRIRDFICINNIDENMKQKLMNFGYFLTVGDLDEAY